MYKICSDDCDFVYYGQTDRALITGIKEHKRSVSHSDQYSKIAKHAEQYDHRFDFDNATIVNKTKNVRERLFLEAWYSLKRIITQEMTISRYRLFTKHFLANQLFNLV